MAARPGGSSVRRTGRRRRPGVADFAAVRSRLRGDLGLGGAFGFAASLTPRRRSIRPSWRRPRLRGRLGASRLPWRRAVALGFGVAAFGFAAVERLAAAVALGFVAAFGFAAVEPWRQPWPSASHRPSASPPTSASSASSAPAGLSPSIGSSSSASIGGADAASADAGSFASGGRGLSPRRLGTLGPRRCWRRDRRLSASAASSATATIGWGGAPRPSGSRWATASNSRIDPATAALSEPDRAPHRDPHEEVGAAAHGRPEALALAADDDHERAAKVALSRGQWRVRLGAGDPEAVTAKVGQSPRRGRRPGPAADARPRPRRP